MQEAVALVGLLILSMGAGGLVKPGYLKDMMDFWIQGKRLYAAGVLRILLGLVLVTGAPSCSWNVAVLVMGILFIIGGVLIFVLGLDKTKSMIRKFAGFSPNRRRGWSLVAVLLGGFIVYCI